MRPRCYRKVPCNAGDGGERKFTKFWEVDGSGDAVQSVRVEVYGAGGVGILSCECVEDDEGS